ncbi:glycosyltransferase family 4 protein [Gymnodinialimonas sp. 2305UL16-5]|uniref:glycosyltransferase family 4 protein n=1 Tax=Gymnodinialimonas mytili TaxID=3126503 RepID=UPI0030965636
MIHYMTPKGVGDAWVGNELRIVRKAGIPVMLHALNRPGQTYFSSDDIAALEQDSRYIYPVSKAAVLAAFIAAPGRFGAPFFAALGEALVGPRENLRNRAVALWHLGVACHWAAGLRDQDVRHIHSQWIHAAGSVAMYGAWLLNRSFSFTGHAADLFRERVALRSKIARAEFIICISEFHRQFYLDNGARPDQLHIAYCGIDTTHFSPVLRSHAEGEPVHILSSGRLVAKKGFPVLIEACGILRERGLNFRCTIAGSGPDEAALRAQIRAADLEGHITLTGEALKQEDIPTFMRSGDIYTLPCIWAEDNDVDGLPQMLMEAMACGLPAVSTRLVGIPDLIRDGETGLLVPPEDAEALAEALHRMAGDEALAKTLAEAGRRHLIDRFDLDTCLDALIDQYRKRLDAT